MTENHEQNEAGMSAAQSGTRSRRRRWTLAGLFGLAAATLTLGACHGGGWGRGEGHGGWHRGAPASAEQAAERVDRGLARMLDRIDATDVQKQRIGAIARQATTEIYPMRAAARDARQRALTLLSADSVDTAALEALRSEQIGNLDTASKRIMQAMADISAELTPAQRAQIRERFASRMPRHED